MHEYSSSINPQRNGVVERKICTLQKMARAMLHGKNLLLLFWAEALNTACHMHNRISLRPGTTQTNYGLWRRRKPNIKYFHIFESICQILADREYRKKWDSKSDVGIFLGYSSNSRAYRVFNNRTQSSMESINVVIDDHHRNCARWRDSMLMFPYDTHVLADKDKNLVPVDKDSESSNLDPKESVSDQIKCSSKIKKNHPLENIIGDLNSGVTTRRKDKGWGKAIIFLANKT